MCDQLSFLSDLDAASDTRKPNLCKTWKNAVMNEYGVFSVNRMDFEAHDKKRTFPNVEIHCAMEYPRVYVSFSLMGMSAGGGSYPNRDDMNFDVHEHPANVRIMIEHALAPKVGNDKKMQKLMREALDKMEKSIKADAESEPAKEQETEAKTDENGWLICKTCGEKFAGLCKDGNCVKCDYKRKHPDAQKKYCEQCIHFRYHALYDEKDHTECCCRLHLEGKNRGEWSYLCNDFFKCETAEQHEIKRAGLMKYASYKKMEKCAECGKNWRWLYGDICGACYEKKRKKADEIARGFKAEGWKEVPENERENAKYSLGGWIDERDMPAMEPRVGTRYFLIDVRHLTWRFFFRKEA